MKATFSIKYCANISFLHFLFSFFTVSLVFAQRITNTVDFIQQLGTKILGITLCGELKKECYVLALSLPQYIAHKTK